MGDGKLFVDFELENEELVLRGLLWLFGGGEVRGRKGVRGC